MGCVTRNTARKVHSAPHSWPGTAGPGQARPTLSRQAVLCAEWLADLSMGKCRAGVAVVSNGCPLKTQAAVKLPASPAAARCAT